jgi:hypothetical protein
MKAGETMALMPQLGWSNAIPDAEAEVDFMVNGTRVKFNGVGYHDSKKPSRSL